MGDVRDDINQVDVLKKKRPAKVMADPLRRLWCSNRTSCIFVSVSVEMPQP